MKCSLTHSCAPRQAEDPVAQAALDAQRARLRVLARRQAADAALVAEPDEGRGARGPAAPAFDQVPPLDTQLHGCMQHAAA